VCLLGSAALVAAPAAVAATGQRRRAAPARTGGRMPTGNAKKRITTTRPVPPPSPAAKRSGRGRPEADRAERGGVLPRPPGQFWPQIDGPPPPSRRPGWEAAPVPNGNVLPPIGERRSGPGVSLGVPTPPLLIEGQSFRGNDPAPQVRQQSGPRLPPPGATVRLPF
jgi:hypothetical protein